MREEDRLRDLAQFAETCGIEGLDVKKAVVSMGENQDGEPVTRVVLLLSDPETDTWDVEQISELRSSLGARATELELPPISLTLVAERELEGLEVKDIDVFA